MNDSMHDASLIKSLVDKTTTLFWFRRDLRLHDNAGLYHALKENEQVLCLFIFDTEILDKLEEKDDARITFIHNSLQHLKEELEAVGSSLLVLHGDPIELFTSLHPKAIYTNHDYEPYALQRDGAVKEILESKRIAFHSYKDQVIFEKSEVVKDDDSPYTVFTPYSKKWKSKLNDFYKKSYPSKKYFSSFKKCKSIPLLDITTFGFTPSEIGVPPRIIKRSIIETYDKTRNYPALDGTTKLSVHLRFGTVSIRKLVQVAASTNETWMNELIWREFYMMILWHFPHTEKSFKPAYDHIVWRNNPDEFKAWCEGQTGFPIVDAGMRELNATGYMHNRVRMITASFLTKHLLIDWRWGEAYFAKKLLDFDLAANNGGWQWSAGSGCDAAPYFRVFNPSLQTKKFDAEMKYIKKWIPEFNTPSYPAPLVDHALARDRMLTAYKVALNNVSVK